MLLPTADILLIEIRTCKCGQSFRSPCPEVKRLYRTPIEEPTKHEISRVKEPDEPPMLYAAIREVHISVPACESCFKANASYTQVQAIIPKRPTPAVIWMQATERRGPVVQKTSLPARAFSDAELL